MSWSEEIIQRVWGKGREAPPNDPAIWRKDACGAWIRRADHGNRDSDWGWEIDHINPDGGDELSNLRPLQWKNNVATSAGSLKCVVIASGTKNIERET